MLKKPLKLIPLRCPFCQAAFDQGKPNKRAEGDDVLTFTYGCGAHAGIYKFPGGWRMDIFECNEKKLSQGSATTKNITGLFNEA